MVQPKKVSGVYATISQNTERKPLESLCLHSYGTHPRGSSPPASKCGRGHAYERDVSEMTPSSQLCKLKICSIDGLVFRTRSVY